MASLITSWRAFAPEDCDAEEDPAETDEFAEYGDTVSHLSTTHYDGRHTPVGLGLSLSRNVSGAALADMGASFGQAQKEQQHAPSHHQSHKHQDARYYRPLPPVSLLMRCRALLCTPTPHPTSIHLPSRPCHP